MIAPDTGFFVRLLQGHEGAKAKWQALVEGEEGVVSGLSSVELLRLSPQGGPGPGGRGAPPPGHPRGVCRVVWPDWAIGERAARLSTASTSPGGRPHPGHCPGGGGQGALDGGSGPSELPGKLRVVLLG